MNILQYLQQGGFILPQQSQSQLTYNVPQSAAQVTNTAMQVDQNALNRYVQLEQLNLQKSQADRSFFTTLETQRQQRETNDRLNKQMDLTNKKLEFEQTKYAYDQFDELLKWEQDNMEPRNRAEWDAILKQHNLDNESILKGDFDAMSFFKQTGLRKSLGLSQSKFLTEKQLIRDGKSLIDAANIQAKEFDDLIIKGVPIKPELLTEFTQAQSTAMRELMQYREGKINTLDLNAPHWQVLSSYPNIINQEMRTEMLQLDMDKKKQAIESAKIQSVIDQEELKIKQQTLSSTILEKNMDAMESILKQSGTLSVLSEVLPGVNPNNAKEMYDAILNLSPEKAEELRKKLEKERAKSGAKPSALEMWMNASPEEQKKMEEFYKVSQTHSTNRNSSMDYNYSGLPQSSSEQGITSTKKETNFYGGFSIDNKTNEITDITINGTTRNVKDLKQLGGAGVNVILKNSRGGYQDAFLEINLNTPEGKKFLSSYGKRYQSEDPRQQAWSLYRDIMLAPPWNRSIEMITRDFNLYYKKGILTIPSDMAGNKSNQAKASAPKQPAINKPNVINNPEVVKDYYDN